MPFPVKIDEDLPRRVAECLVQCGCDVATVVEQGWGGLKDPELWRRLQKEQRFLVTADKGFGDVRRFPPGTHAGILVLRPSRESVVAFEQLMKEVVEQHEIIGLKGWVTVASPGRIRIRKRR